MDLQNSLNIIAQALEQANNKGAFSLLNETPVINKALEFLTIYVNNQTMDKTPENNPVNKDN